MTSSETNWGLTFSLLKPNGSRLGSFTLYRKDTSTPLWMDLDVFTATGFSQAVAGVVERMQNTWFVKSHKEQIQTAAFETVGPVMASRTHQSVIVPTSS